MYIKENRKGKVEQSSDKEGMVGYLLAGWVSPHPLLSGATQAKTQAVERYMRTYLRGLTTVELEFEAKYTDDNAELSPPIVFKLKQASNGYDRYMARRGKVVV